MVFLGLSARHSTGTSGDVPVFAVDVQAAVPDVEAAEAAFDGTNKFHRNLRKLLLRGRCSLPCPDVALLGTALAMLRWHRKTQFCGSCGAKTTPIEGGVKRRCTDAEACGARFYPRTDPVAIQLVVHGDECLLGKIQLPGYSFFSCLAGFVGASESLEEAVRRETFEETGVKVGAVQYVASQPWPIGRGNYSQLMLGCIAEATSTAVTVNTDELAGAQWVTRDALAKALARCEPRDPAAPAAPAAAADGGGAGGGADDDGDDGDDVLRVPAYYALAHTLMRHWVDSGAGAKL